MDYEIPGNETDETCFVPWTDGFRSVHDTKINHKINNLPWETQERDAIKSKELKIELAREKISELKEEIKEHRQRIKHSKTTKKLLTKDLTHKAPFSTVPEGCVRLVMNDPDNDRIYRPVEE